MGNRRNIEVDSSKPVERPSIKTFMARFETAITLHQEGQLIEAEALCRELLQFDQNHFDLLQLLATIALQRNDFITALALLDQVLAIDPHHPGLLIQRGLALTELKRYEEALTSYDKAIAINPENIEAHANREVVIKELKNQENLKADFAAILEVKSRLRALESLSISEQREFQDKQLKDLFLHAWQHSDWWRTRLSDAGYRDDNTGSVFPVLTNLPPLLRTDLQEHFEGLRAWRSDWTDKDIVTSTTSGSTGIPVRVEKYRALYNLIYIAVLLIDHEWHGRDARQPLACITAEEDSIRQDWGSFYVALQGSGTAINRNASRRTSHDHAAWLLEHRPVYLMSTAFRAAEIGGLLIQEGKTLPLHQIISQYERVTPRQRDICIKAFGGAKIIDRYSCEEVGWLALQCPYHEHLHVMAGTTIIEIVDENLKPCPVGEAGRVLVTSMHSYAMPIIRYDIGDIAEWGEECDCGIKLPVIKRLWGRKRNLIMLTSGQLIPMGFIGDDIAKIASIREFRLIQQKNGVIDFFVRAERTLTEEETETLRSFIYKVDPKLTVNIREVSFIEWGKGLKREEFVRVDA